MANKKNDKKRAEIVKLRNQGKTLEQIAKELNISAPLVHYYLKTKNK